MGYCETPDGWQDYELTDTGGGEKLECWGKVRVARPDPQVIWPRSRPAAWDDVHMRYERSRSGGGRWERLAENIPHRWTIAYKTLRFHIRPTDFKHMGLFPEQAVNWEWAAQRIKSAGRPIRVLNLFAYTGGATVACLQAGAEVTHVDAAKGMNQWAKENIELSGLSHTRHRILTDDVMKFIRREARRGRMYEAVIMDPPVYGHGPAGELWKLENHLYELAEAGAAILSPQPLFLLLNMYTAGISPVAAANVLRLAAGDIKTPGHVTCNEIGLKAAASGVVLPCGLYARWEAGAH